MRRILNHQMLYIMPNAPQLIRPRVDRGIRQEIWLFFTCRWDAFKIGSKISSQNASIQLFPCAHDKLGDLMLANDPRLVAKSDEYVAKLMESVAVIKKLQLVLKEQNL